MHPPASPREFHGFLASEARCSTPGWLARHLIGPKIRSRPLSPPALRREIFCGVYHEASSAGPSFLFNRFLFRPIRFYSTFRGTCIISSCRTLLLVILEVFLQSNNQFNASTKTPPLPASNVVFRALTSPPTYSFFLPFLMVSRRRHPYIHPSPRHGLKLL